MVESVPEWPGIHRLGARPLRTSRWCRLQVGQESTSNPKSEIPDRTAWESMPSELMPARPGCPTQFLISGFKIGFCPISRFPITEGPHLFFELCGKCAV